MAKINTAGELREFMAAMLVAVKDGKVKHEDMRVINNTAAQINENYYAEAKISMLQKQLGRETYPMGDLPINK